MKTPKTRHRIARVLSSLIFLNYCLNYPVFAFPQGGRVSTGSASFSTAGDVMKIVAGNKSIINYQSFDISNSEIVQFIQPGSNSAVLNRVLNGDPSYIFGTLEANGRVFIVNPSGIFFENGSMVNVGSLIAGAGNISDSDFLAGRVHLTNLGGTVSNQGSISAKGTIGLFGSSVTNLGSLVSKNGLVALEAGDGVLLGERGGNIYVKTRSGGAAAAAGAPAAVQQGGSIQGRRVVLAAGDIYSVAISQNSSISGQSVTVTAGRYGTANISGSINASNTNNGGRGGKIKLLGGTVNLRGATLLADGPAGGGQILVGGNLHGKGMLPTATTTTVDSASQIHADATGDGAGGEVVVWANDATSFDGAITARGGPMGGAGGLVETSGKLDLGVGDTASVDATGITGAAGVWLMDPQNVEIIAGGNPIPPGGIPPGGSGVYTIDNGAIETALAGGNNVTIETNSATGSANGNISVESPITANSGNNNVLLYLEANGSIQIDSPITLSANAGNTASLMLDTTTLDTNLAISHAIAGAGAITANSLTLWSGASSANSAINLTGQINIGTLNFVAAGSLNLTNPANTIAGLGGGANSANGAVAIQDNETFTVGFGGIDNSSTVSITTTTGDIQGGSGELVSDGLTLSAAGGIGTTSSVNTGTTGPISLTTKGVGAAGDINIIEAHALNTSNVSLTTDASTAQTVNITSAAGPITLGKDLGNSMDTFLFTAENGTIVTGNFTAGSLTLDAEDASIVDPSGTPPILNVTNALNLTAEGFGTISLATQINAASLSFLSDGVANFSNPANAIGGTGATAIANGAVTIKDTVAFTVGAPGITSAGNPITITTTSGGITGAGAITGSTLSLTTGPGTASPINLTGKITATTLNFSAGGLASFSNTANLIGATGATASKAGGAITIDDGEAFSVGTGGISAGTNPISITLSASNLNIGGSGPLTGSIVSLTAGGGTGSILLNGSQITANVLNFSGYIAQFENTGNLIGGTGGTATATFGVNIQDDTTFTVGPGGINAGSQALVINAITGNIVGGAGALAGGSISLTAAGGIGIGTPVNIAAGVAAISLTAKASGPAGDVAIIDQSTTGFNLSAISLSVDASAGQSISVTADGSMNVNTSFGNTLDSLTLDSLIGSLSGVGNLTASVLNLTSGATGSINLAGQIDTPVLNFSSGGAASFGGLNNLIAGTGSTASTAGGNVTIQDAQTFTLGAGGLSAGSNSISIATSSGDIDGSSGGLTAGSLTLNAAGGIGISAPVDISIPAAGAISLTSMGIGAAGNISVIDANALNTSNVTINTTHATTGQTISLTSASGPLTLGKNIGNSTDNFIFTATAGNIVTGNFTANDLTLDAVSGSIVDPTGATPALTASVLTLDTGAGGTVNLATQIDATTLNFSSGASVDLSNLGNLIGGTGGTATAAGPITIQDSQAFIVGAGGISAGANPITITTSSGGITGAGALNGTTVSLATGPGATSTINLTGQITANNLDFSSGGFASFTNAGNLIASAGATASTAGGNVNIQDNETFTVGAGGINAGVSLIAIDTLIGDIDGSSGTLRGGSLSLTAAGGIGISAPVNISIPSTGTIILTSMGAGAAGNISVIDANALNTSNVTIDTTHATTGQTVSLTSASGPLTLGNNIGNSTDNFIFTATAGNIVTGNFTANNLTLDAVSGSIVDPTGATPALTASVLTLDTGAGGTINLATQIDATTLNFSSGASVDLSNLGNMIGSTGSPASMASGAVTIRDAEAFTVGGGGISAGANPITITTSSGGITGAGALKGTTVSLATGPGAGSTINLTGQITAPTLIFSSGGLASFTNAGNLIGGTGGAASTAGGSVDIQDNETFTVGTGGINAGVSLTTIDTLTGDIDGSSGGLTAGSLTLNAAGGIGISAPVDISIPAAGVISLTSMGIGAAGNISVIDANALNTSNVTINTTHATTGQTVSLTSVSGPLTLGKNIGNSTDNFIFTATAGNIVTGNFTANDLTLDAVSGSIVDPTGATSALTASVLALDTGAGGTINLATQIDATTLNFSSGASVDLSNLGNLIGGTGGTATAAGPITIQDSEAFIVGAGGISAGANPITVTTSSGGITGAGALNGTTVSLATGPGATSTINLTGQITASTLIFSSGGLASFTNARNLIGGTGGTASASGGNVTIQDNEAFTIGAGGINAGSNLISITTTAGDIDGGTGTLTSGNLILIAAGGIGISAPVNVDTPTTGTITLTTKGVAAAGNISIVEANALNTSEVILSTDSSAQTISLTSLAGPVTVDGNIGNTADDVTLIAEAGNIVGGAGTITANNLTLDAAGGIGIGTPVDTNAKGTINLITTGAGALGDIYVVEANALNTSQVVLSTDSSAHTISLASLAGPVTVDGNIGNAADDITLIAEAGNIVGGAGTVTANNLTLDAAGGIGIGTPVDTNTKGTINLITTGAGALGDIYVVEANALNTSRVNLSTAPSEQTISLTSLAGPVTLDSNIGNTTDDFSFTATSGNILVDTSFVANALTLNAPGTNANITFNNNLSIGSLNTTASSIVFDVAGSATAPTIATTGDQIYTGTVVFDQNSALASIDSTSPLAIGSGDITFSGNLIDGHASSVPADGHSRVSIVTNGTVTIVGRPAQTPVNYANALLSIQVNPAPGPQNPGSLSNKSGTAIVNLGGGIAGSATQIITILNQLYNGSTVNINGTVALDSRDGSVSIPSGVDDGAPPSSIGSLKAAGELSISAAVDVGVSLAPITPSTQPNPYNLIAGDVYIGGPVGFSPQTSLFRDSAVTLDKLVVSAGNDILVNDARIGGALEFDAADRLYLIGDKYDANAVVFNNEASDFFPNTNFDSTIIHMDSTDPGVTSYAPLLYYNDGGLLAPTDSWANLSITAASIFQTGSPQALYVNSGSLTITAPAVDLGDVAAAFVLTIDAGTINVENRGQFDQGAALLAGKQLNFPDGKPMENGVPTGRPIEESGGVLTTEFYQDTAEPIQPSPIAELIPPVAIAPTDAAITTGTTFIIPGDWEHAAGNIDQLGGLAPGLTNDMADLGIYARMPTPEESGELIKNRSAIYRQPIEGKPVMESSDYKVVVNRLTAVEVLRITGVYESIVGGNAHKFGAVPNVLDREIGKYFHDTHSADIADFGKWLDASVGADTNAARALEILQRLKRIYIEEQKIGLTPKEIEISQNTITAKFAPHGLGAADFKKIIDSVNPAPLNEHPL